MSVEVAIARQLTSALQADKPTEKVEIWTPEGSRRVGPEGSRNAEPDRTKSASKAWRREEESNADSRR